MKNIVTALTGAAIAAQGWLMAKWPENTRDWTLFGLCVLIGLGTSLGGKAVNRQIDKKAEPGQ